MNKRNMKLNERNINTYRVAQESYSKTRPQLKICGNRYKDSDSPFPQRKVGLD